MGTKSYIVRGLGNPESFESCSHGAGRVMSRTKAKKRFTVEDQIAATHELPLAELAERPDHVARSLDVLGRLAERRRHHLHRVGLIHDRGLVAGRAHRRR